MVRPVESFNNWVCDLPKTSPILRIAALIPVVSNVFVEIKYQQFAKCYANRKDNTEESIKQYQAISTVCQWSVVEAVVLVAVIIFACEFCPLLLLAVPFFALSQLHQFIRIGQCHKVISEGNKLVADMCVL